MEIEILFVGNTMIGIASAIEFESEEEAKDFLKMVLLNYPDFKMNGAHIVESILYYDGGYVSGARAMELMMEELNERI